MISHVIASGEPLAAERIEGLTDEGITLLLQATAAGIARLEAVQVRVTAEFSRRREDPADARKELAKTLKITTKSADELIKASRALTTTLPQTYAMMQDGQVTFDRASKVTKATRYLTYDAMRSADAEVAPRLVDKNAEQACRAAYYAAQKVKPENTNPDAPGSDDSPRPRRRRKKCGLALSSQNADSATLTLSGVPVKEATRAFSKISQAAEVLMTPDEQRSLDQLCAAVALELLLAASDGDPGRPVRSAPPRRPGTDSRPKPRSGRGRRSRRQSGKAGTAQRRRAERRAAAARRRSARRKRV